MNAVTTPHAKRKGANELFIDFLDKYRLSDGILPLVKLQLTKLFNYFNESNAKNDKAVRVQLEGLEKKLNDLKIRHALGEIDKEMYNLAYAHLTTRIHDVSKELNTLMIPLSNLDKLISTALKKLRNLGQVWASSDLENKRRIQKTLFPDGIYYNVRKHEYLTTKTNMFVELTSSISMNYAEKNKGNFQHYAENSPPVPRTGIEPVIHP